MCYHRRSVTRAFNCQFGSVFRSGNNSSYFFRKLHRVSDIYTSDLTNLLNYSSDHLFYPFPNVLPHDYHTLYCM
ncbi:5'-nucleotidase domain-containing protein 2 [Frankliniella fusca]|uniref:5'-nucleotidase domain-containing protein 2 n=1 Tax=Frankliniella fusca TaxID=407009 RepID=A0AAE1H2Z8_9NEOP|nr:5'-nucleotidase domain-containing protein 2 [Frankliniella fusca]